MSDENMLFATEDEQAAELDKKELDLYHSAAEHPPVV